MVLCSFQLTYMSNISCNHLGFERILIWLARLFFFLFTWIWFCVVIFLSDNLVVLIGLCISSIGFTVSLWRITNFAGYVSLSLLVCLHFNYQLILQWYFLMSSCQIHSLDIGLGSDGSLCWLFLLLYQEVLATIPPFPFHFLTTSLVSTVTIGFVYLWRKKVYWNSVLKKKKKKKKCSKSK